MKQTLDVDTIVCGHGPMGEGEAALDSLIEYLEGLQMAVREAIAAGCTLKETLETTPLPEHYGVPNVDELNQTLQQMHRLNVLATYRIENERDTVTQ
jgi:cyclase